MKRIILAVLTLCVVFASCSKEEAFNDLSDYTFNFTFTKDTPADTKSVKSEWEDGDIVWIAFQGCPDGLLKMTFNGQTNNWTSSVLGEIDFSKLETLSKKTLFAIWVDGNNTPDFNKEGFKLLSLTGSSYKFEFSHDYLFCGGVKYTVDGRTVTSEIHLSQGNYARVSVTNLSYEKNWLISCDKIKASITPDMTVLDESSVNSTLYSMASAISQWIGHIADEDITDIPGIEYEDGHYFCGQVTIKRVGGMTPAPTPGAVFTLTDGTNTYQKSFSGKTLKDGMAIKIAGPLTNPDGSLVEGKENGWTVL